MDYDDFKAESTKNVMNVVDRIAFLILLLIFAIFTSIGI